MHYTRVIRFIVQRRYITCMVPAGSVMFVSFDVFGLSPLSGSADVSEVFGALLTTTLTASQVNRRWSRRRSRHAVESRTKYCRHHPLQVGFGT